VAAPAIPCAPSIIQLVRRQSQTALLAANRDEAGVLQQMLLDPRTFEADLATTQQMTANEIQKQSSEARGCVDVGSLACDRPACARSVLKLIRGRLKFATVHALSSLFTSTDCSKTIPQTFD
jgi:hypothetical protein